MTGTSTAFSATICHSDLPGSLESLAPYFIGYSAVYGLCEKMLERMFIGNPQVCMNRLLDFSTPLTGCTFFARLLREPAHRASTQMMTRWYGAWIKSSFRRLVS